MIRNQWYVLLESSEVRQKPVGVIRMGERMVFWRDSHGKVHCAIDQCPHRGAQFGQGAVVDDHLQCPFHGFEFAPSGACVHIPANGRDGVIPSTMRLHTYPVHEERGFLWVWWGKNPPAGLEPPAFFDNIDDSFYHASVRDPWDAHYSRAIENQLDVVHLPFVHCKTIGRGGRTLVDGPLIKWYGGKMLYTYVFNRADDGTPPRKPSQLSVREATSVHLEFILPNLWQNYISNDTRIVIAFVPVDDAHSILYIRFYQRFLPVPILGTLAAKLAMPMNLYIAHEDRHVVITQQPKVSRLKIGEALIQGDLPIIEYRRKREELQNT